MKNTKSFLKKSHLRFFLQNRAKSAIKHFKNDHDTRTRFKFLCCAFRVWRFVPFKTQSWGETTLSALSLSLFLFFSREKRSTSRREHREKSTNHHQNTVISSHHAESTFHAEERFESKETWGKWRNRRALSTRCACSLSSLFFKVVFFVSFFFFLLSLTAFSLSLSLS